MTIRARVDRHSLWHPREDVELEATTMDEICLMLSENVAKEIRYSLVNDERIQDSCNPLAMRISESDGRPHRVKWQNVSKFYDIRVEVEVSAVKKVGDGVKSREKPRKQPKRAEE